MIALVTLADHREKNLIYNLSYGSHLLSLCSMLIPHTNKYRSPSTDTVFCLSHEVLVVVGFSVAGPKRLNPS